jgi:hypothetical protein
MLESAARRYYAELCPSGMERIDNPHEASAQLHVHSKLISFVFLQPIILYPQASHDT